VVAEDDAVLDGTAAGEAGGAQFLDVTDEAEGPGGRDLPQEIVLVVVELIRLPADRRMIEVDSVLQHEVIRGRHADELVSLDDFDRLPKTEHRNARSELADA